MKGTTQKNPNKKYDLICVYVCLCFFYVFDIIILFGCDVVSWKVPCGLNCYVVLFLCCFKPKVDCRFVVVVLVYFSPMLYTHSHTRQAQEHTHCTVMLVCKALAERINKNEGNYIRVFVCSTDLHQGLIHIYMQKKHNIQNPRMMVWGVEEHAHCKHTMCVTRTPGCFASLFTFHMEFKFEFEI